MTFPLKLTFHILRIASIGRGNEELCSNWIRTLVAMATYSSDRLLIGKEEIDHFSVLEFYSYVY